MPPGLCDLCQIQIEIVSSPQQGESLSIGLHHAVLDAIVNHLDKVPAADGTRVQPAPARRRRQNLYNRFQLSESLFATSYH